MIELREVRHAFTMVNGLRLHRLEFGGSGRPILCLHGVTGNAWVWHDAIGPLLAIGQVMSVDMRGYGDSQWSAGAYTTDDHVADLEGLVSGLGPGAVDLAGSSWGGLVALAFAARNPGLVRRLALVDVEPSSAQGETDLFPRPRSFASHEEAVEAERKANPHAPDTMVEVMALMGTAPGPDGHLVRKHDPLFFERWPFRSDDRWEELRSLKMPVLVVHAQESFIKAEVAERMAQEIPEAKLVNIPASGHVIPVEQPEALGRALAEFFAAPSRKVASWEAWTGGYRSSPAGPAGSGGRTASAWPTRGRPSWWPTWSTVSRSWTRSNPGGGRPWPCTST